MFLSLLFSLVLLSVKASFAFEYFSELHLIKIWTLILEQAV